MQRAAGLSPPVSQGAGTSQGVVMAGEEKGAHDNADPRAQHRLARPASRGAGPRNPHFSKSHRGFCPIGSVGNHCSRHLEQRSRTWLLWPCWLLDNTVGARNVCSFFGKAHSHEHVAHADPPRPPQPHRHTYAISRGAVVFPTWGHKKRSCQG